MREKIKIYVPKSVNDILTKDMERFEMYKKDGTLNKNEFYNTLIVNYYQQYQKNQSDYFEHIKKTISENTDCDDYSTSSIASSILQYIDSRNLQLESQKSDVTLSMKPTKQSSEAIDFIQDYYLQSTSLSGYFRNMFSSYSLLPQDKRERIIFKKNFDVIEQAIASNRKVYFTTINNDNGHVASPYCICNSKEELFNYLLAQYNDYPYSYRVSRLKKLVVLSEQSSFSDKNIDVFEKMIFNGPQFAYHKDDTGMVIIRLTNKGKQIYQTHYVHRPQYLEIKDDVYYFQCPTTQAFDYFCRFGKNAIVLQPQSLAESLRRYYSMANRTYQALFHKTDSEEKEN